MITLVSICLRSITSTNIDIHIYIVITNKQNTGHHVVLTIVVGEITSLAHEAWNDTMEG